jgi:hypothetical protein
MFVIALLYVTKVFGYGGMDGRLEARESGFPARMFTLPLRTSVLVGWPMLQGVVAVVLLWVTWASFVLRPSGIEVPLGMTAALAAALVALLQALLWSPFGLPWLRVLAAALVLPPLLLAALYGPDYGAPEVGLLGLFAALVPAAYAVARAGVARARCGDNPEWQVLSELRIRVTPRKERPRRPFPSPARAQLWIEWQRHAPSFLFPVGGYLVLLLASYLSWVHWGGGDRIKLLLLFPAAPLLFAPFLGFEFGRAGETPGNRHLLSSFTATRPMTSTALVAAKLKAAALATLAGWALVTLTVVIGLVATGAYAEVPGGWQHLVQENDVWKVALTALLVAVGLFLVIWKMLINCLFITLAGRPWIERGIGLAISLGLPLVALLFSRWAGDYPAFFEALRNRLNQPDFLEALQHTLTWGAGGSVLLKLTIAAVVLRALVRRGLLEARTLAKLLGLWLFLTGALFTLAYVAVPAVPVSLLACGVVLSLPLARVAAAPLALAWNRHR